MADTPDFQLGFAAGFKLGSDAKDYKKQIEDFRAAERDAKEATKRADQDRHHAHEMSEQWKRAHAEHETRVAEWEAKRNAERKKLDDDGDSVLAMRQQLERREGQLPERENAVLSRENAVAARERDIARREEVADGVKRKYEVLLAKIDAARAGV